MADKYYSERNLKFLLYEVHEAQRLGELPYFEEFNREVSDLILDSAAKFAREELRPIFRNMDQVPPRYEDGTIKVHPRIKAIMRSSGENGWLAAACPYDVGGQQMPMTILMATSIIFNSANFSASAYFLLTTGAAHLIHSFGSDELKRKYMTKMFTGQWQGTMALTEPQAGSSLSDVASLAEPTDHGYYRLRGQKIFISAGDHDGVDNVVHLLLARIQGAPPGVKGISLFVVPKHRMTVDGGLEFNDVHTAGIYHKMGYKGCPITQLSFGENGDCRAWLVGQPHRGLSYMFQMMNEARIGVGVQAASIASAAYYASLQYAQERPQGRPIAAKNPTMPQVPIITHADVKRMLLFQRSVVDGSLSLILQGAKYSDLAAYGPEDAREPKALLLDLLTPVIKTYPSEIGIQSVSQGLQILGGYGYCDEFPLEQHYRDMRIHPIHEGTTGIQGLDLLGRKAIMKNGQAMALYLKEMEKTVNAAAEFKELQPYSRRLKLAMEKIQPVTSYLVGHAIKGDVELFLADSTLYLEFLGIIAIAWQWLLQGLAAQRGLAAQPSPADEKFYAGKLTTMKYFFHYELPKIEGLSQRLAEGDGLTVRASADVFAD